ncbi:unnamed protein product, partial [Symbiodinium pilosum]
MEGVVVSRQAWAPRAWLARFRLEPAEGRTHITERALYALEPLIPEHLGSPFPFHVKVMLSLHIEKLDPARGELIRDSFIQNVVPWRSLPANDPAYRMHSLVAAMRWKYETARERASLPGSGWEIVGIEWMDVLIAPGLENVPAPGVGGGCNVRLPESLHQRKGIWCPQVSSRCFEFCIRAAFLGVAEMDAAERTELALRTHFKTRQCRHDFEGRVSKISTPKGKSAKLRYFTKTSCELSPVIVYADFEVFSQNSIQFAAAEGVQNRIAAAAYSAVGMCGYEPPEAHKLWMEHAREGEHECAVALQFLRSLMGLLDHYKNWRMNEKKPLVWTAEHRTQHQQARECRECRRVFCNKSGRRKVAHHDHGTGSWLGALRENCNQAAHVPYDITICFHNGGRYDFHFVLRALAKFKYHAKLEQNRRAVAGKIRKFGVKELARRVKLVQERAAAFGSSKSKPLL